MEPLDVLLHSLPPYVSPQPPAPVNLLSMPVDSRVLDSSCKHMVFCGWLLSLHTMLVRLIRGVAHASPAFLLMTGGYSVVCAPHSQFIHASTCGCSSGCHPFGCRESYCQSLGVQGFSWTQVCRSLGQAPSRGRLYFVCYVQLHGARFVHLHFFLFMSIFHIWVFIGHHSPEVKLRSAARLTSP